MKPLVNRIAAALGNLVHPAATGLHLRGRRLGFRPATLDYATMQIHGSPPDHTIAAKATLVAGFERDGIFYTQRSVERACGEWTAAG